MQYLSESILRSLTPEDSGKRLFDGEGLYGRVHLQRKGLVVRFEFRYKLSGKSRSVTCGKWPDKSLEQIRRLRSDYRMMIDQGVDPVEERRLERIRRELSMLQKKRDLYRQIEEIHAEISRLTGKDSNPGD